MKKKRALALFLALTMVMSLLTVPTAMAAGQSDEDYDGSQLWLNYTLVDDEALLAQYQAAAASIVVENFDQTPTYRHEVGQGVEWEPQQPEDAQETVVTSTLEAAKLELHRAFEGLLGVDVPDAQAVEADGAVVVGTPDSSPIIAALDLSGDLEAVGDEGYLIRSVTIGGHKATVIAGSTDVGALYGVYAYLRLMQTQKDVTSLDIADFPRVNHRRLNNWDTERLYASTSPTGEGIGGQGEDGSIFNFKPSTGDLRLPLILDRYIIFARMCASVGINEITINNVNADFNYLSEEYIQREAALADVLRPYGVRIGLSVRYVAPSDDKCNTQADIDAGGPAKVDPKDENAANPYAPIFQDWWTQKTEQIRSRIPDFLGYTVKANSEGQPGPQDYGYDHGDGAHGMGQALEHVEDGKPNDMTLFWRTFVYNADVDVDRLKRPYMEFVPINDAPDRGFGDNVFVQTKNGPLDFQGREPFHPMFGAMDQTNQAIEVQITQEYTGHHVSLCYLAPMWEEVFKSDTYAEGEGTLVGEIIDGTAQGQKDTAIVGVNNIGNSANMTGHHFSQANFFAFGRQAWDWTLTSEEIADDWIRMTWGNDQEVVDTIMEMMMGSWEALVSYQTPLGVAHQMGGTGTHYFPNPSQIIYNGGQIRDDWSPAYYGRVDGVGMGYNRSGNQEQTSFGMQQGSDLAGQYSPELEEQYNDMEAVPENLMLWFHHVPWDFEMDSGRTFWEEIVYRTQMGVQYVTWMREAWASLEGKIDQGRFDAVAEKLWRQEIDAGEWRDFYAGYWQANNGLDKPVDDGPLSIAITLGEGDKTKTYQGFDLAVDAFNKQVAGNLPKNHPDYNRYIAAGGQIADASGAPFNSMFVPVDTSYTVPVPAGIAHKISVVSFLGGEGTNADYEIVSQDDHGAVVRVTREGFFGPLVKYYNFNFVSDATLSGIDVGGVPVRSFDPERLSYSVWIHEGQNEVPQIAAERSDPTANVTVTQAGAIPGTATITVENGGEENIYTVALVRPAAVEERFDGTELADAWSWVREDQTNWSLSGGALTVTTQEGDLKGGSNTAKNLLLLPAGDGDWMAEVKVTFSAIPSQAGQQGGLVIYQDDDNYIRAGLEYMGGWQAYLREASGKENGGTYSDVYYDALETEENLAVSENTLWLRVVKEGDVYKSYFATDPDAAYRNIGITSANLENPRVGLMAVHGAGAEALDVTFDDFKLTDLGQHSLPVAITVGEQSGSLTAGTSGSVKFQVETENLADGQIVTLNNLDGVAGISLDRSVLQDGAAELTIRTTAATPSGSHRLSVTIDGAESEVFELVVDSSGSGGGGGGSSAATYTITVEKAEHGAVKASVTRAAARAAVTLTATADEGYRLDTITVIDAKGNEIKLTDKGSGKFTFSMPAAKVTVTARFKAVDTAPGSDVAILSDLDKDAWYYESVSYVVSKGLMNGVGDGLFQPNGTMTRAMVAQVLYNMEGKPASSATSFTDVPAVAWYHDAVSWAAGKSIVTGYGDGRFGPEDPVTREQMVAILYRYAQGKGMETAAGDLGAFTDSGSVADWAKDAMGWAVKAGIINGKGEGKLDPQGTATRAEIAKILMVFDRK